MRHPSPSGPEAESPSRNLAETRPVISCPYCESREIIKKGQRKKKYERVQLYFCQRCERKFTPFIKKHYSYPLKVILEALTLYNRFYSLQETAKIVSGTYGLPVTHHTIANWLKSFTEYMSILKTRAALLALYDPRRAFIESRLLHG
jgi:transposase-like protein